MGKSIRREIEKYFGLGLRMGKARRDKGDEVGDTICEKKNVTE